MTWGLWICGKREKAEIEKGGSRQKVKRLALAEVSGASLQKHNYFANYHRIVLKSAFRVMSYGVQAVIELPTRLLMLQKYHFGRFP
jgi:hypothetical protein